MSEQSRHGGFFVSAKTTDEEVVRTVYSLGLNYHGILDDVKKDYIKLVAKLYEEATGTWSEKNKPETKTSQWSTVAMGAGWYKIDISITVRGWVDYWGDVLGWLDYGTKGPYPILPVRAKALRFHSGYTRKTPDPPKWKAGPGGPFGDVVFRKAVMHPGIKPMGISRRIGQELNRRSPTMLDKALSNAIGGIW